MTFDDYSLDFSANQPDPEEYREKHDISPTKMSEVSTKHIPKPLLEWLAKINQRRNNQKFYE